MKQRKLKAFVIPSILTILGIVVMVAVITTIKNTDEEMKGLTINYVSNSILSEDIPVINTAVKVIYPFLDPSVTVGKSYYDYKGTKEEQEKSIIYHENTYIQNSGVDFINDKEFDVIAVLNGTVTSVKEDKLLGNIVEISHNNEYVSIYQSLGNVKVKKGDTITQGQIIGTSGANVLDKDLGNHLHFEFYAGGQIVDPTLYLDKELTSKE